MQRGSWQYRALRGTGSVSPSWLDYERWSRGTRCRPLVAEVAARPRSHPLPSPAHPRKPARRHPPRLPTNPNPLRRTPRLAHRTRQKQPCGLTASSGGMSSLVRSMQRAREFGRPAHPPPERGCARRLLMRETVLPSREGRLCEVVQRLVWRFCYEILARPVPAVARRPTPPATTSRSSVPPGSRSS